MGVVSWKSIYYELVLGALSDCLVKCLMFHPVRRFLAVLRSAAAAAAAAVADNPPAC